MLTQYNSNSFACGVNGFGAPFCKKHLHCHNLAVATDTSLTVPSVSSLGNFPSTSEAKILAVFSYEPSKKVYVALNATAAVPVGAPFAASTSELFHQQNSCMLAIRHFIRSRCRCISCVLSNRNLNDVDKNS